MSLFLKEGEPPLTIFKRYKNYVENETSKPIRVVCLAMYKNGKCGISMGGGVLLGCRYAATCLHLMYEINKYGVKKVIFFVFFEDFPMFSLGKVFKKYMQQKVRSEISMSAFENIKQQFQDFSKKFSPLQRTAYRGDVFLPTMKNLEAPKALSRFRLFDVQCRDGVNFGYMRKSEYGNDVVIIKLKHRVIREDYLKRIKIPIKFNKEWKEKLVEEKRSFRVFYFGNRTKIPKDKKKNWKGSKKFFRMATDYFAKFPDPTKDKYDSSASSGEDDEEENELKKRIRKAEKEINEKWPNVPLVEKKGHFEVEKTEVNIVECYGDLFTERGGKIYFGKRAFGIYPLTIRSNIGESNENKEFQKIGEMIKLVKREEINEKNENTSTVSVQNDCDKNEIVKRLYKLEWHVDPKKNPETGPIVKDFLPFLGFGEEGLSGTNVHIYTFSVNGDGSSEKNLLNDEEILHSSLGLVRGGRLWAVKRENVLDFDGCIFNVALWNASINSIMYETIVDIVDKDLQRVEKFSKEKQFFKRKRDLLIKFWVPLGS